MSLLKKGTGKKIDIIDFTNQLLDKNVWYSGLLIIGACVANVVLVLLIDAVAGFLVNLLHIHFYGLVTASLFAVLSLVRHLCVTWLVYDVLLKRNALHFDERVRYVLFLVLNFVVYALGDVLVAVATSGLGLYTLVQTPLNYVGLASLTRLIGVLIDLQYVFRYDGFIFGLIYLCYQAIEIVSIALSAGWIIKLVSDEASEHDKTLVQVITEPFKTQKDVELNASLLTEMSYVQDTESSVEDLLPVSEELVDMYCTVHSNYFGTDKMLLVRNRLLVMNELQFQQATSLEYINPDMMLMVSAVSGSFGMDRFLLGDVAVGLVKMLTFGCFGVLTLIDLFTIRKKTQDKNFMKIMSI